MPKQPTYLIINKHGRVPANCIPFVPKKFAKLCSVYPKSTVTRQVDLREALGVNGDIGALQHQLDLLEEENWIEVTQNVDNTEVNISYFPELEAYHERVERGTPSKVNNRVERIWKDLMFERLGAIKEFTNSDRACYHRALKVLDQPMLISLFEEYWVVDSPWRNHDNFTEFYAKYPAILAEESTLRSMEARDRQRGKKQPEKRLTFQENIQGQIDDAMELGNTVRADELRALLEEVANGKN